MIFSTGLKKIYESINKLPKNKQAEMFNDLQEKILENSALSYKFELLEAIKAKKNSFSVVTARKFVDRIKEKHNNFLKENNSVAFFYKEEKKLFEYFNINQKEVISEKLDLIVNKKNNSLNEQVILDYIVNPNIVDNDTAMRNKMSDIREMYTTMKQSKDEKALLREFRRIALDNKNITGQKHDMIKSSLKTLREEAYKDLDKAITKTYKLRIISEKILKEYPGDSVAAPNVKTADEWDNEEGGNEPSSTETINTSNFTHIKAAVIDLPSGKVYDSIGLRFTVAVYPTSTTMANLMVEAPKINKIFLQFKHAFVTKCMYQQNIKVLDPVGINWQLSVPVNNNPQGKADATAKQVASQGYFSLPVKFDLRIFISKKVHTDEYVAAASKALAAFDAYLSTVDQIADIMTPEVQIENWKNTGEGRVKTYGKRDGADKYYKDKAHDSTLSDKWTDNVFTGDVEDSHVAAPDPEEVATAPVEDDEFDDDKIDKMATKNAKAGKFFKK